MSFPIHILFAPVKERIGGGVTVTVVHDWQTVSFLPVSAYLTRKGTVRQPKNGESAQVVHSLQNVRKTLLYPLDSPAERGHQNQRHQEIPRAVQ